MGNLTPRGVTVRGIATYIGPSGGTTTVPVLDWMRVPKAITTPSGEIRTLALAVHEDANPLLSALAPHLAPVASADAAERAEAWRQVLLAHQSPRETQESEDARFDRDLDALLERAERQGDPLDALLFVMERCDERADFPAAVIDEAIRVLRQRLTASERQVLLVYQQCNAEMGTLVDVVEAKHMRQRWQECAA